VGAAASFTALLTAAVAAAVLTVGVAGVGLWLFTRINLFPPVPPTPPPLPEPTRERPLVAPDKVEVVAGRQATILVKSLGPVGWIRNPDLSDKVDLSFIKYDKNKPGDYDKQLTITGVAPGTYHIPAVTVVDGDQTDPVFVKIIVMGEGPQPPPTPDPTPTPTPPTPTPPTPPTPPEPKPQPAPIAGDGLRVLIVYDKKSDKILPESQQAILFGQDTLQYLDTVCAVGTDGKTREYRIYPNTAVMDKAEKHWQDAMRRPRQSLPWLIVSNPKIGGYEGPLPASVAEAKSLIGKYEGK
jgi:hypothetical protein